MGPNVFGGNGPTCKRKRFLTDRSRSSLIYGICTIRQSFNYLRVSGNYVERYELR